MYTNLLLVVNSYKLPYCTVYTYSMCSKYLLRFYINEIPGAKDLGSQEILILAPAGGRKLSGDIYIFIPSLANMA